MQFYKGKSFRTFGPVGPYLCLFEAKDIGYLQKLQLRLTVNGQTRQNDSTANLVYGPAETLTELSGVHDFAPGDLIATGTPARLRTVHTFAGQAAYRRRYCRKR
nr:fumarylacetoacetate hydrolase family protein [Pseudomonas aeruginosa]